MLALLLTPDNQASQFLSDYSTQNCRYCRSVHQTSLVTWASNFLVRCGSHARRLMLVALDWTRHPLPERISKSDLAIINRQ